MSGLVKAKKYDWKDSNMALFGSDLERNVKKDAAETEKAWRGCGQKLGVQIWRIVKFKVTDWPQEDYGSFYNGDSYIILRTYKKDPKSEELDYDVHFWIGKYSTQDEYGTAAYKTVELDTFLDDKPVQHREVQGHESQLFKSYFPIFSIWKGGADTGFRRVEPTKYVPRLLEVHAEKKRCEVTERPMKFENLNKDDVFIIDLGLTIYRWMGEDANIKERYSSGQSVQQLNSERGGKANVITLDDQTPEMLPEELKQYFSVGTKRSKDRPDAKPKVELCLSRVSDASGTLQIKEIARGGAVQRSQLQRDDVFILDTGLECFVWVGQGASVDERRKGMEFAHNYLMKTDHPFVPTHVVKDGKEPDNFNKLF